MKTPNFLGVNLGVFTPKDSERFEVFKFPGELFCTKFYTFFFTCDFIWRTYLLVELRETIAQSRQILAE